MEILDLLNHLLNFAAPAVALSLMMPIFARLTGAGHASKRGLGVQAVVNFVACLAVLLVGLLIGGRDGKMLSYTAMVVACATTQWSMRRG